MSKAMQHGEPLTLPVENNFSKPSGFGGALGCTRAECPRAALAQ